MVNFGRFLGLPRKLRWSLGTSWRHGGPDFSQHNPVRILVLEAIFEATLAHMEPLSAPKQHPNDSKKRLLTGFIMVGPISNTIWEPNMSSHK